MQELVELIKGLLSVAILTRIGLFALVLFVGLNIQPRQEGSASGSTIHKDDVKKNEQCLARGAAREPTKEHKENNGFVDPCFPPNDNASTQSEQ